MIELKYTKTYLFLNFVFYRLLIYALPLEIQLARGEGWVEIRLTGLCLLHVCACPKAEHGCSTLYISVFVWVMSSVEMIDVCLFC
jgi:hypothetical protein